MKNHLLFLPLAHLSTLARMLEPKTLDDVWVPKKSMVFYDNKILNFDSKKSIKL